MRSKVVLPETIEVAARDGHGSMAGKRLLSERTQVFAAGVAAGVNYLQVDTAPFQAV